MFWRAFSSRVVRWQGRRSAELMANVGSTLPWMYYNRLTPFLGEGLTNKIWWEKLGRLKSTKIQWVIDIFVTEQSAGFINSCILKKKLGVKTWAVVFDNFNSMGLNTSNCFLYRSHCILLKDMLSNKQTSWGTKPPYMSFLFLLLSDLLMMFLISDLFVPRQTFQDPQKRALVLRDRSRRDRGTLMFEKPKVSFMFAFLCIFDMTGVEGSLVINYFHLQFSMVEFFVSFTPSSISHTLEASNEATATRGQLEMVVTEHAATCLLVLHTNCNNTSW